MKDASVKAGKITKDTASKGKSWSIKDNVSKDKSWKIKDKIFKIKIADLLNETWREDQITFEKKFSDQLPNLTDEGMAWSFTIQSLNNTSLLWTLTDVTTSFHEVCESCGTTFDRPVEIPSYTARFIFEDEIKKEKDANESEEVLFTIDPKAETINIEDMVVQSILLNDPFVKRCPSCTKRLEAINDDDEDLGEFVSRWNINFS